MINELIQDVIKAKPRDLAESHFQIFEEKCKMAYNRPVTTMAELKQKHNKKVKGDVFEQFAKLYFQHIYHLKDVWLLNELPDDERTYLQLKSRDVGIDLIAKDETGLYYAIQVKFITKKVKKSIVGWSKLSTFYALCLTTGGPNKWHKHIVFTNADGIKHMGQRTEKDVSICRGTLDKLSLMDFVTMSGVKGNQLNIDIKEELIKDEPIKEEPMKKETKEEIIEVIEIPKEEVIKPRIRAKRKLSKKDVVQLRDVRLQYYSNLFKKEDNLT